MIYDALNSLGRLSSPQLNAYIEDDLVARSVYLAFRFDGVEIDDSIYLRLINLVTNFEGRLAWCMYNYKSTKNYVIEPLTFYYRRRELQSGDDRKLCSSFESDKFLALMKDAVEDLRILSKQIRDSSIVSGG